MKPIRIIDEIDVWAERLFGPKTKQNRRVSVRKGLDKAEAARRFNALFRAVQ